MHNNNLDEKRVRCPGLFDLRLGICLKELMNTVRIDSISAKIRTRHFRNTDKPYRCVSLRVCLKFER